MNTTRKQYEDAIAALIGVTDKPRKTAIMQHAVRLDKVGLHYQGATATPPEWTFAGEAYADPDALKKVAREIGKPGDVTGPVEAIEQKDGATQVKIKGVTLPAIPKKIAEAIRNGQVSPGHRPGDPEGADRSSFTVEDVAAVAGCASRDDMRPVLTSVHFCPDAVVATDSWRLYVDTGQATNEASYNLPGQVIRAVKARKAERMDITTDGGNGRTVTVEFTTGTGVEVSANVEVIDGQYPDYRRLFPDAWEVTAPLNVKDAGTVDPATAAAKVARWCEGNRPGVLCFNERVTIATDDGNPGGKVEPVTISQPVEDHRKASSKALDGEKAGEVKIGINPEFFQAASEYVEGGTLHAISPLKPVMIERGTRRALIMPIRLND